MHMISKKVGVLAIAGVFSLVCLVLGAIYVVRGLELVGSATGNALAGAPHVGDNSSADNWPAFGSRTY